MFKFSRITKLKFLLAAVLTISLVSCFGQNYTSYFTGSPADIITSPQGAVIKTTEGKEVINFCANNYLGLSSHPRVIDAAKRAIDTHGFGMSSVRFICGTQDIHKELERKIAEFLRTDDAILYAAAFDANGGVFEPLFGAEDAIISDELNHASIIDGVRLSKAMRFR